MSKTSRPRLAFEWDPRREVLVPSDAFAAEIAKRELPERVRLNITWTKAQVNDQKSKREAWNGWYWAGLGCFLENHDDPLNRWPTQRDLHRTVCEELNYVEKEWKIDGSYKLVAKSFKFDEMPDEEFYDFFERARVLFLTKFGWDPFDGWAAEKQLKAFLEQYK